MNTNLLKWLRVAPNLLTMRERAYLDELEGETICPAKADCLRALEMVGPDQVRCVILGQDPYHSTGSIVVDDETDSISFERVRLTCKANGLAFGYHRDWNGAVDSSMRNILQELGNPVQFDATLEKWAGQGVLLLNTRLSVRAGTPMSHADLGWESVVLDVLRHIVYMQPETGKDIPWLLWGKEARDMAAAAGLSTTSSDPSVVVTSHPCKFSHMRSTENAPAFTGSNCFARINEYLKSINQEEIQWT